MHNSLGNAKRQSAVAANTHRIIIAVQPDMLMTLGDDYLPDQECQENQAIGPFP